jgi:hypothetical protein
MTIRAPARPLSSPLNILDGTVIGRSVRRYRRQEFIHFLNALERGVASGKFIRGMVGNYAAHNSQLTFNFTPISASRLNAVEGFFAPYTKRRLHLRKP